MKNKRIQKVKVVSKDFIQDFVAKIQNVFGANLNTYEKMIEKAINQIETELENEGIVLSWYRYEISQLTNGAMAVMLYGESK